MKKTTVDLDERLINKAVEIFKGKTKKEIITLALREFVARHEQKDLYDLFNADESFISEDYDYKLMRGYTEGGINDIS